jgi:hypothetical protein
MLRRLRTRIAVIPQRPPPPSPPLPARPPAAPDSFRAVADLRFAGDDLPWQRSLRWAPLPRDRRLLWLGIGLAVLVTLLELAGFALGMRQVPLPRPAPVVQVVLIEPEAEPPPPPPEPVPPIVVRASRIAVEPPKVTEPPPPPPPPPEDSDAMRARIGAGGTGAAPQLFNPDGSVRLGGAAPVAPKAPANPREAARARWAEIEERGNPLDCRKTRFADAFAPDESVGDRVARKYLKWVGLADPEAIGHRAAKRAESGGCEPPPK